MIKKPKNWENFVLLSYLALSLTLYGSLSFHKMFSCPVLLKRKCCTETEFCLQRTESSCVNLDKAGCEWAHRHIITNARS